ncbi:hypothetical protein DN757_19150 [Paenibacillus silvae]|uniref:Uncharacterized protein n=1 Tax=Paenibacillus silvae TaxID=1325358 RepID=A0A2W6NEK4_9BACL|nr:hypothetical protein DN757_19150 [Paenibacillus silvae]
MGFQKNRQIEKAEHERECIECGHTVWIEWDNSPNLNCSECGTVADVVPCERDGNLVYASKEIRLCDTCLDAYDRQ